jgi:hypothetical protein
METDGIQKLLPAVRRLAGWCQHADEQTEARVRALNETIQALSHAGGLAPLVVLGDLFVVYGASDSDHDLSPTRVHQCGLLTPYGVGVVPWDPSALGRAENNPGGLDAEARQHFVCYEACGAALKQLIHANLKSFLARVEADLPSSAG